MKVIKWLLIALVVVVGGAFIYKKVKASAADKPAVKPEPTKTPAQQIASDAIEHGGAFLQDFLADIKP